MCKFHTSQSARKGAFIVQEDIGESLDSGVNSINAMDKQGY